MSIADEKCEVFVFKVNELMMNVDWSHTDDDERYSTDNVVILDISDDNNGILE